MERRFNIFQSIYIKIPLLFVFILVIAFQFIGVFFIDQLETQTLNQFKSQINNQVEFLVNNLSPILSQEQSEVQQRNRLNQTLNTFTSSNRTDIRVINTEEYIIASNYNFQEQAIGIKTNEEAIKNALVNRQTLAEEIYLPHTKEHLYYIVRPILASDTGDILGVVAVGSNMNSVYDNMSSIMHLFIRSALLAIGAGIIVAIVLSQGLTRPIQNIKEQATRISEGNYSYPAKVYGQDELGELALTINELALKVKEAQESTESERQRLDGVLKHMTDGVIATDRRGNVIMVNQRANQLLKTHSEQVHGISILRLLGLNQDYTIKDLLQRDTEIMIRRQERSGLTILNSEFSVIRRESGFVTGFVCVLTDVTEQEKTEQERRDFVSNVSHELRTPLTSIKSYSEALQEGAWRDEDVAPAFLEVIQSETNRMIRMIGNLLDLSKMDGGQYVMQPEYVDFKRFLDHILDRFDFMLESGEATKKYKIVRQYTTRDAYVEIDQDRIIQVVDNIMNNAIKYSPEGGVITVRLTENLDEVTLSISDQGMGIPTEDLEQLFDRFYRVDRARSREQGGTGLGLAISKEVIELHGGRIWAESKENEGSTFFFTLPYTSFDSINESWDDTL